MTREEAMKALGVETQSELAKVLTAYNPSKPVSRFSVCRWKGAIPELRRLQIEEMKRNAK